MRPFAIALVGLVLGQPGNVLNGNWTANFQGTTYVRLAFAEGATAPQGTMSIAKSIHVDDEGNVDSGVRPLPSTCRSRSRSGSRKRPSARPTHHLGPALND